MTKRAHVSGKRGPAFDSIPELLPTGAGHPRRRPDGARDTQNPSGRTAGAAGGSPVTFDKARRDALDDLDALRRKEFGEWRTVSNRKYPPSTPEGFAWAIKPKEK